jgi:hypothetical protein
MAVLATANIAGNPAISFRRNLQSVNSESRGYFGEDQQRLGIVGHHITLSADFLGVWVADRQV